MPCYPLVPALLALGFATLISVPQQAHAQTTQVSQKPVLTTLHRFGYDIYGANPFSGLTLGKDGNFYGTTFDTATVYKMTPEGQFTTLHRFTGVGAQSHIAALTQGTDGAFYGVADRGSSQNSGMAFRITSDGQFKILHEFAGPDGAFPESPLLQAPDGSFYGTTEFGGAGSSGTVFHMAANGTVTTLHSFQVVTNSIQVNDGRHPFGRIAFGTDGALYGTTNQGGAQGGGTLYRLTTDGASFKVLHDFIYTSGENDYAGLTAGPDGACYGVTAGGGINDSGVAYKITPSGVFTVLHKFSKDGHGVNPFASLILGADGNFYGTTPLGGTPTASAPTGAGMVFKMTPAGTVTTLYKFHPAFDGYYPLGSIAFGPDGALYGTTYVGGTKDAGTIFKLTLPQ